MWWKRLKKPNEKNEEKLRQDIEKEGGLDKKDLPAMIFSAMLVFLPVAALVLGIFCLVIFIIF